MSHDTAGANGVYLLNKRQQRQCRDLIVRINLLTIKLSKAQIDAVDLMSFGDERSLVFVVVSGLRLMYMRKINTLTQEVISLRSQVNAFLDELSQIEALVLHNYAIQLPEVSSVLTTNTEWEAEVNSNQDKLIQLLDDMANSLYDLWG